MTTPTETPKKSKNILLIAIIVGGIGLVSISICGILAAIAVPAFLRSVKKSKTAEAEMTLTKVAMDIQAQHISTCKLPPSLPPLFKPACDGKKSIPTPEAIAAWKNAGINISPDPMYFSYSTELSPDGKTYNIIAKADFSCGGMMHTITKTLTVNGKCSLQDAPNVTTNEYE